MKAQGTVKGILVEGSDGQEYLLGFSRSQPTPTPTLSRRQADGSFRAVEDLQEASRLAVADVPLDRVQGGAEGVPSGSDLADLALVRHGRET